MDIGWRNILYNNLENNNLTDVYEFGVFSGQSMKEIAFIYNKLGIKIRKFFGLDSFEGLPQEKEEPLWQECWKKGDFDSRKLFEVNNIEKCMIKIYDIIKPYAAYSKFETMLIPGFYEDILDKYSPQKYDMQPANYIDIDVDIYSSAKFVLDFVFNNKIAVPGTIIGYDDWGGSPGWQTRSNGESRAHAEIEEMHNINFKLLEQCGNSYPHVARLFKVVSIGSIK